MFGNIIKWIWYLTHPLQIPTEVPPPKEIFFLPFLKPWISRVIDRIQGSRNPPTILVTADWDDEKLKMVRKNNPSFEIILSRHLVTVTQMLGIYLTEFGFNPKHDLYPNSKSYWQNIEQDTLMVIRSEEPHKIEELELGEFSHSLVFEFQDHPEIAIQLLKNYGYLVSDQDYVLVTDQNSPFYLQLFRVLFSRQVGAQSYHILAILLTDQEFLNTEIGRDITKIGTFAKAAAYRRLFDCKEIKLLSLKKEEFGLDIRIMDHFSSIIVN